MNSKKDFRQVAVPRPPRVERLMLWAGVVFLVLAALLALFAASSDGWVAWISGIGSAILLISGLIGYASSITPESQNRRVR